MGLKVLGIGLIALSLAACSSRPPSPAPVAHETAAAAVATNAAATNAAAATPAKSATELAAEGVNIDRSYIKAGFKPTMYKGQLFYCRTVDVTGTSFKKKVCLDEAHMREEVRKIQEMQDAMIRGRANPPCTPMPACGG